MTATTVAAASRRRRLPSPAAAVRRRNHSENQPAGCKQDQTAQSCHAPSVQAPMFASSGSVAMMPPPAASLLSHQPNNHSEPPRTLLKNELLRVQQDSGKTSCSIFLSPALSPHRRSSIFLTQCLSVLASLAAPPGTQVQSVLGSCWVRDEGPSPAAGSRQELAGRAQGLQLRT